MNQQNHFSNLPPPVRFTIVLVIVLVLFACIEILPLYLGPSQLTWVQLKAEILKHLPRTLLIAGGVALMMTFRGKRENRDS